MAYSYDRRAAVDYKRFLRKLLGDAEGDLKSFMAAEGITERVDVRFETPPPRGGYGPYEVGKLLVGGFDVQVTVDVPKAEVSIGAKSGNHVLERLWSRGTVKEAPARLRKPLDFIKEQLAREAKKVAPEPVQVQEEAWSVVTLGKAHSYATEVDVYGSKSEAETEARERGDCYVVKGTQMWNEPLGQVEEHDRTAPSKYFP